MLPQSGGDPAAFERSPNAREPIPQSGKGIELNDRRLTIRAPGGGTPDPSRCQDRKPERTDLAAWSVRIMKTKPNLASDDPKPTRSSQAGGVALEQLQTAVRGIRFGEVRVIIQDGVIVQIERLEKQRLR